MELYHKQNVTNITTLVSDEDGSVKQTCYFPPSKEVQIYRASPDVEEGCCFMRIQKFI